MSAAGPGGLTGVAARGASWYGASRVLVQLVQFGVGLFLARILLPSDFGLAAGAVIFSTFGALLFEGGLRSALVHAQTVSQSILSSVFWFNLLSGFVLAGVLWCVSPLVAKLYDEPLSGALLAVSGLSFVFAVGSVHAALMLRDFRFGLVATIESVSSCVGILATLALALLNVGAFSLVLGPIAAQALASAWLMLAQRWVPTRFSFRALWSLARFSVPLVGASSIDYWGRNVDTILVGAFLGVGPLGLYNRAYNLVLLPVVQVTGSVGSSVSPVLASFSADSERLLRAYVRGVRVLCSVVLPCLVGLAATAPGLVPILWGDRWSGVVGPMQILALAAIPQAVAATAPWLYQARRRTGTMLAQTALWGVVGAICIAVGVRFGLQGVAVAVFARAWLGAPFEIAVAMKGLPVGFSRLGREIARSFVGSIAMGMLVWLLPILVRAGRVDPRIVLAQCVLGVMLIVLFYLLFNRQALSDLRSVSRR